MRVKKNVRSEVCIDLPYWISNQGPQSDLVISTRVRLARNLAKYRFPYHAGRSERSRVFDLVAEVIESEKEFSSFAVVNCNSITPIERQLLFEARIISPDLITAEGDRGVAVDGHEHTAVMINEEDHLRLLAVESGYAPEEVWERVNRLDDSLGRYLSYAYDVRRGFLTSCPTNSGTGLRISFLLHLPGLTLTRTIDSVLLAASHMGISTRGFFGEHSEIVGNLFQLSNQATLGLGEEEFIQNTRKVVDEVLSHERKARKRILDDASMELSDKVFRSWGILLHAKMLTVNEFLNLASALRLGIDCGIFKEIPIERLNKAVMMVMPAHLQQYRHKTIPEEQEACERADVVRELLGVSVRRRTTTRPKGTRVSGKKIAERGDDKS